MRIDRELVCPCCSGKLYRDCCSLYHQGQEPENALVLMRSRYSAYALNNAAYIIRTTYLGHPAASHLQSWKEEILKFSLNTDFENLEILCFKEQAERAIVVFIAHLRQEGEDVSFTERSFFVKIDGHWRYVNGDVFSGVNREVQAQF